MEKKITIKEVAKLSGVSITTASLILNGNTERFSPRTVQKVLAIKEELGHQPDHFAGQMTTKETRTTGVLAPGITNPLFSTLMRGIEDILYNQNFATILCNAGSDHQKEIEYLAELIRRSADGFIIMTSAVSIGAVNENLKKQGRPLIVLDQKKFEGLSDAIRIDDFRGGYLAGMRLLGLGHQMTALIYPENPSENAHVRIDGFKSALDVYQIPYDRLIFLPTQFSKQGGYQITAKLFDPAATGVSTLSNELVFGLYHGLEEARKSISEDYSIIGYDNIDMCEYIKPKLTTTAQPILELGQTSAQLLLDRIQFPEREWEEKRLPMRLEKKFSTAPLK